MIPPKPAARPEKVSLLRSLRLFRQDILSAQPARLYRAWMAESCQGTLMILPGIS